MRLLVTGGVGFLGSNFCCKIIDNVDILVIIDKINYCGNVKNIKTIISSNKLILIKEDILQANLKYILEYHNIDTVIHFAAQTHVDNSYDGFFNFISDNITATHVLLERCKNYGLVKKIIHMSTDEVYGPSSTNKLSESSNFNPTNPYAASKASAEMVVNSYKFSYKLPIIILRCNNIYGPGQYPEKIIPKFTSLIMRGRSMTIHGDGHKVRDYIYIDDVVDAVKCVLYNGKINEVYNIGCDNPRSILDITNDLKNILNKGEIEHVADRPFNDDRYYVNCDKLKKLGWNLKISWEEGLQKTLMWILQNPSYWDEDMEIGKNIIDTFKDDRGELKFTNKLITNIKQQFISYNNKNVLRGIHCSPYGKLVTCLKGSMIDFIVNLNKDSNLFLSKKSICLYEGDQIYIPPLYGHGFHSLEDDTQLLYQLEGVYNELAELNINLMDPFINLGLSINANYLMSDKDISHKFTTPVNYVILGSSGFIGSNICKELDKAKRSYITLTTRLEDTETLEKQFKLYKPLYVISSAGISGKPTTAWCESHKEETLFVNVILQVKLAKLCSKLNIHLTLIGSGLVFKNNQIYNEDSIPDKDDIFYCQARVLLEKTLEYNNLLYLRVLYPISGDMHEKCFLTKLLQRIKTVHDTKINISILPSLLKYLPNLIESNTTGILNFVNSELISLDDILQLYYNKYNKAKDWTIINTNSSCPELNTSLFKNLCPDLESSSQLSNYI